MNPEWIVAILALVGAIVSVIMVISRFSTRQAVLVARVDAIEDRVDTIWRFSMRRAFSEAVDRRVVREEESDA